MAADIVSRRVAVIAVTGVTTAYGDLLPSLPEVVAVCGKAARTESGREARVTRVPTAKPIHFCSWGAFETCRLHRAMSAFRVKRHDARRDIDDAENEKYDA
jgi:hypothetical protein